ncbi:MAG: hypothetical protein ACLVEU_08605 [Bacteroides cellulosilyticus]
MKDFGVGVRVYSATIVIPGGGIDFKNRGFMVQSWLGTQQSVNTGIAWRGS